MAAAPEPTPDPKVERRVLDETEKWRREQFETLGFPETRAYTMAVLRDDLLGGYVFDLGRVRDLVGRGCDRDTIWAIIL